MSLLTAVRRIVGDPWPHATIGGGGGTLPYGFPDTEVRNVCSCGWTSQWRGYFNAEYHRGDDDATWNAHLAEQHTRTVERRPVVYVRQVGSEKEESSERL